RAPASLIAPGGRITLASNVCAPRRLRGSRRVFPRRRGSARRGRVGPRGARGVSAAPRLAAAVARFPGRQVVVVGDLIADEYLYGKPARISREAPVLILRFTGREVRLGGAANAAHNVRTMGARPLPVGALGADAAGREVRALFARADIGTAGLV